MSDKFTWLDRAVSYLSPTLGAKRAQARAVLAALLSYEAARPGRAHAGWVTSGTSADADVVAAHGSMRKAARSLVQNNPHAKKGLEVIVGNQVGTGILAQASDARTDGRRPNKARNQRLNDRWKRWVDRCDARYSLDFYGLQALVARTRSESGECLVRFVPSVPDDVRRDAAFRLLVLEPDHLDTEKSGPGASSGSDIRHGIEYENNRPVAYWLFDEHPGDTATYRARRNYASQRVAASEVLHVFKPLRAGQTRGITDFAAVMLRLRALDDYDDAEVMRKKIAACLAAFVTTPAGLPAGTLAPVAPDSSGRNVEAFAPGMIGYLKPGESVQFSDPKPSDGYGEFNKVQLHAIAAGLGVPYELLTGDLSEVTYTSHRGGLVQFRGAVEADQWQVLIPQFMTRVWRRFCVEANKLDGNLDPDTEATFTPPRFGLLDPAKEVPAMIEAIQGGIRTWPDTVRREGYDPTETLDEIQTWQEELTRRGITITSDARNQKAQAAAPAPAAEPDADEADDSEDTPQAAA